MTWSMHLELKQNSSSLHSELFVIKYFYGYPNQWPEKWWKILILIKLKFNWKHYLLFIYSFTRLFNCSFVYSFIYLFIYLFIRLFIYLFIYLFIRSFIRLFIYWLLHWLIDWLLIKCVQFLIKYLTSFW